MNVVKKALSYVFSVCAAARTSCDSYVRVCQDSTDVGEKSIFTAKNDGKRCRMIEAILVQKSFCRPLEMYSFPKAMGKLHLLYNMFLLCTGTTRYSMSFQPCHC